MPGVLSTAPAGATALSSRGCHRLFGGATVRNRDFHDVQHRRRAKLSAKFIVELDLHDQRIRRARNRILRANENIRIRPHFVAGRNGDSLGDAREILRSVKLAEQLQRRTAILHRLVVHRHVVRIGPIAEDAPAGEASVVPFKAAVLKAVVARRCSRIRGRSR